MCKLVLLVEFKSNVYLHELNQINLMLVKIIILLNELI